MLNKIEGNLLDLQEGIMVHGCNCLGVMGSGFADQIRNKWPTVYNSYKFEYDNNGLFLGQTIAVTGYGITDEENDKISRHHDTYISDTLPKRVIVVNAMTQYDYGRDPSILYVDYDALAAAFARVKMIARDTGLPVHFPLIGCGLANGKWEEVERIIENTLGDEISKTLWIYK